MKSLEDRKREILEKIRKKHKVSDYTGYKKVYDITINQALTLLNALDKPRRLSEEEIQKAILNWIKKWNEQKIVKEDYNPTFNIDIQSKVAHAIWLAQEEKGKC